MSDDPPPRALSRRGRGVRLVATIATLTLLLAGTFWGDQDHFPFAPFSQYAGSPETTGEFTALSLVGVTAAGDEVRLPFARFGLRRAEVERQLRALGRTPVSMLPQLAEAYARLNPRAPSLRRLAMVEVIVRLRGSVPVARRERTLAVWAAP